MPYSGLERKQNIASQENFYLWASLYGDVTYNREGYTEKKSFYKKVCRKVARKLSEDGGVEVTFVFRLSGAAIKCTNCPNSTPASSLETLQSKYDKQCLLKNVAEYVNIVTPPLRKLNLLGR